jgi:PAS domain S-box-containing protein
MNPRSLVPHALALLMAGLATGLTAWLWPHNSQSPFALYYPAILVTAIYGSTEGGVSALVLSSLAVNYFFIAPLNAFSLTPDGFLSAGLFGFAGSLFIAIIHRLKEGESRLRLSDERLRTVTDTAQVGLVIVDEEHRCRYANRAYAEMLNLPVETLVGARVADVLTAVYDTQIRPHLDRAFQGEPVTYEMRLPPLAPETEDRHYAVSYEPSADRSGKIVVVVIANVTALKRTETKLRESLQETVSLKAALNEHAIVAITDPQGCITEVNDKFCEISQYAREELIGQDHRLINSGAHSKAFFRNLWTTIGQGHVWQGDIKNKAKDGSFYWVATTIVPFLDPDGKPRQYVAIRADITARKLAEEACGRLSGIVRSSSDAIIGKTLDGIITSWNRSAEKVFGYREAEAVGQPMLMLFPPDLVDEEKDILARIMRDETVPNYETQRLRKDGRRIEVSVTVSPVQDSEGRIVGASKIARDITEQKRVEAALRQSEERLQAVTENLTEGLIVSSLDGELLHWNRAGLEMHGYSNREDGLRMLAEFADTFELFTLDGFAMSFDAWPMTRVLRGERLRDLEVRIHRRDRDWKRVFSYSGGIVQDASGRPLAFLAINDITERKRAEEALRESESRFKLIFESLPVGVAWAHTQPDGRLTRVINQAHLRICGLTPAQDQILGIYRRLRHPDDSARQDELSRQVDEGRIDDFSMEKRYVRLDGTVVWVVYSFQRRRGVDGGFQEVTTVIDITERKHAEEALRESESRYRTLFENAPDGIVIADPQSYYLDANVSACRMLGYTREELIGLHATDIVAPPEIEYIEPALSAIKTRPDYHREWQLRRKDNSVFAAEVIATMMPDGNLLGMLRDITARKHADAALLEVEKEKQMAFEANRLKSEFLANMSHELRTPLNCILGFTEFLVDEKPGALNPKQKEYLTDVYNSSKHLLQLINDVLDLAKVESGKTDLHPETFPLAKAIGEVCAVVKGIAQKKNVSVRCAVAPELVSVTLDPQKFKQVCYNLLANAVKFTDPGGSVDIRALAREGGRFEVRVTDTGIGIRPEDMQRLFREFEQLETGSARRFEGTGLGLALTKKLVEAHGGSIAVESEHGKGSAFSVILPGVILEAKGHE